MQIRRSHVVVGLVCALLGSVAGFMARDPIRIWGLKPFALTSNTDWTVITCHAVDISYFNTDLTERSGVEIGCDGQVKVLGPRDAAAQAFWDKVIELTPMTHFQTPRKIEQLRR